MFGECNEHIPSIMQKRKEMRAHITRVSSAYQVIIVVACLLFRRKKVNVVNGVNEHQLINKTKKGKTECVYVCVRLYSVAFVCRCQLLFSVAIRSHRCIHAFCCCCCPFPYTYLINITYRHRKQQESLVSFVPFAITHNTSK